MKTQRRVRGRGLGVSVPSGAPSSWESASAAGAWCLFQALLLVTSASVHGALLPSQGTRFPLGQAGGDFSFPGRAVLISSFPGVWYRLPSFGASFLMKDTHSDQASPLLPETFQTFARKPAPHGPGVNDQGASHRLCSRRWKLNGFLANASDTNSELSDSVGAWVFCSFVCLFVCLF